MLRAGYKLQGNLREEIIEKFLPLINRMAGRLALGLPPHVDKGDLVSSGILGLLDALNRYDPARGQLDHYVTLRIQGAMLDELRRLSWLPRNLIARARELEKAYGELSSSLGRHPSEEELAAYLKISKKALAELRAQINLKSILSLEGFLFPGDGDSVCLADTLEDGSEEVDPEKKFLRQERLERLTAAIEKLEEREKLLLNLYYREELTLKEIGRILDISESRVSQLHSRAINKLRQLLEEEG